MKKLVRKPFKNLKYIKMTAMFQPTTKLSKYGLQKKRTKFGKLCVENRFDFSLYEDCDSFVFCHLPEK